MMRGQKIKASDYTAANSMPVKLMRNWEVLYDIKMKNKIPCYHAQMILTNKCNLNCSFCSCRDDDRKTEMPIQTALETVSALKWHGMKSITITGGGEPLLYSKINEFIDFVGCSNTEIGLVTNGILLNRLESFDNIKWCRISFADEREYNHQFLKNVKDSVLKGCNVDWAFSYVVGKNPNFHNIRSLVELANICKFTHVRIVTDILEQEYINLDAVKKDLVLSGVDDSRVIYQQRHYAQRGGPCYIGYLKPVIGADNKVYMCCGSQYALHDGNREMAQKLCLGDVKDIDQIMSNTRKPFDGTICGKCYYHDYNKILDIMVHGGSHESFL